MVLHNSKWDKKATRDYNKKHGIVNTKLVGGSGYKPKYGPPKNAQEQNNSEDSEDSEDDNEEEQNPDNLSSLIPDAAGPPPPSSRRSKRNIKNLPSNNWRYNDPASDEETSLPTTVEEEEKILAELSRKAALRQIEEQQLQLARSVKLDPKAINIDAINAAELKKKHKKKGKYGNADDDDEYYDDVLDDEEEEFLTATAAPSSSIVKPKKGQVQVFEDKTEFYALQQQIEKDKAAKEIKRKFGFNTKSKSTKKGQDDDDDEEDIDDFLSNIDGLQITSSITGPTNSGIKKRETPSLFSGSTSIPQKQGSMQNTEAWLDNLLN